MNPIALHPPVSLRSYAAPLTASPKPADEPTFLDELVGTAAISSTAAGIGIATSMGGFEAALPVAAAILGQHSSVGAVFGGLHFAMLSLGGMYATIAGTTVAGAIVSMRAMEAPSAGFLEKPAAAIRDGVANVNGASTLSEATRAGASAGWKAGQTFGTIGGGIQGAFSGYSLGGSAAALVASSVGLGIAGAVAGAVIGGAALAIGGRYIGGAIGAGVGAASGAVAHAVR